MIYSLIKEIISVFSFFLNGQGTLTNSDKHAIKWCFYMFTKPTSLHRQHLHVRKNLLKNSLFTTINNIKAVKFSL